MEKKTVKMCGIAGLYHLKGGAVPSYSLKKMCDSMSHRGPDDEGYVFFHVRNEPYADEGYWMECGKDLPGFKDHFSWKEAFSSNGDFNLALGHRRLSIIDLSSNAHQPMSNRTNGRWIVFNGEIYNFRELRQELKEKGHYFFSGSDTEVIIHLYEEYGEEAVRLLNGIFAFALWDGKKNRLLLARDRYGAKPLYYTVRNDLLAFASEAKALFQVEGIKPSLDLRAFCDYFTFQNTFGSITLFENISILEPGNYITVQDGRIMKKQYWDFSFEEAEDRGEEYYIENMRECLEEAIERQLAADVPVGSYLSGGLDSSTITAYASKFIPRLMTFTGGFDVATAVSLEHFFDERDKAELMSRQFGTEHYQMVIHAGDLEWALPKVIWHTEDLRVGMSYPHYYLSRLAGKFVKVVLSGPGGDETLGGYPWRYQLVQNCRTCAEFEAVSYRYWSRLVSDEEKKNFFSTRICKELGKYSPFESLRAIISQDNNTNFIKKALYVDAKTFLHGILIIEDKLSMAHSLESRVPFLDNRLVDFTSKIPVKYLINNSWIPQAREDINVSGKYILRRSMERILPGEILKNRKQGFSAPDQSWYMKQLIDYIHRIILSDQALDRGYFKKERLEAVVDDHIKGRANYRLLIWSLLSFEWWNRIFIDGENYACKI
ncbi:MAG: asparagine synthase (glutamine-hydrolyzing) [Syntrophales bacterium]|nr:asparagine synthase (glutamine-hydrolyzing) [Syntrophales bacterium]MDY0045443.1 asparagine synthase (glutamine-hydrolyzing) [Syntrophales bacterium]